MQNGRVGHSGGPPSVSLPATGARLLTVVRAYLVPLFPAGEDPPGLFPPVLVPPPPDEHAASTRASDSTVAPRANLRPFRMGSPPLLKSRRPRRPPKEH